MLLGKGKQKVGVELEGRRGAFGHQVAGSMKMVPYDHGADGANFGMKFIDHCRCKQLNLRFAVMMNWI